MSDGFGDPAAVQAQGALLTGAGTSVDTSVHAITSQVATLIGDAGWTGTAASSFSTAWDADAVTATSMSTAFTNAGAALTTLGTTLSTCRSKAVTRADQARREGAPVAADGSLEYTPLTPDSTAAWNRYAEDVGLLVKQADSARATARAVIERSVAALLQQRTLRAGDALHSALDAAEAGGNYTAVNATLAKMTPAQVAAFIASLSPTEQQALALHDPSGIGNLDGVPLPLRATADHILVQRDLAAAKASGDTAQVKLDQQLLDSGGSVILFDPHADHYGVLYGDITKAQHVAVFVPGVGDDTNINGWDNNAKRLQQQSPGSAVIMWKGYDDPTIGPDAAVNGHAEAGATDLTRFSAGLNLTPGQTYTVVAHSYGTVVAGQALAHDGLHATNAVFLGSPGTVVNHASELHLGQGNFYDEKAPNDYVANNLGGFGTDPSSPDFGGIRLKTNSDGLPDVSGHSEYFSANSQSLTGIADVVEGKVPHSDVQDPTLGDYSRDPVSKVETQLLFPDHVLTDTLEHHYHGPGSGIIQGLDHVETGVGKNIGTLTGNVIDGAGDLIDDILP